MAYKGAGFGQESGGYLPPLHPNLIQSMAFVLDGLFRGKLFWAFNVMDDYNQEVLTISIDTSLIGLRVISELDTAGMERQT